MPLTRIDPVEAAPLADAGRTSYHAVQRALPRLRPRSTALVIGAGGLGGYTIQWLRAMSTAHVIACDVAEHRRQAAREFGAHDIVDSSRDAAAAVLDLTHGRGADAVFDFFGSDSTIDTALRRARPLGSVAIVGAEGGTANVRWGSVPLECDVYIPLGGTHADLHEVVALAEQGLARSRIERFSFHDTPRAYERLRAGDIDGRAVVVPE